MNKIIAEIKAIGSIKHQMLVQKLDFYVYSIKEQIYYTMYVIFISIFTYENVKDIITHFYNEYIAKFNNKYKIPISMDPRIAESKTRISDINVIINRDVMATLKSKPLITEAIISKISVSFTKLKNDIPLKDYHKDEVLKTNLNDMLYKIVLTCLAELFNDVFDEFKTFIEINSNKGTEKVIWCYIDRCWCYIDRCLY